MKIRNCFYLLLSVPLLTGITNCHKPFDEPPAYHGPMISSNTSIQN